MINRRASLAAVAFSSLLVIGVITVGSGTARAAAPQTLFGSAVPAHPSDSDSAKVELGTQFTTTTAGSITAISFYKGSSNTGTHTGKIYGSSGTVLASVNFSGETSSGWQSVTIPTPVPVVPGKTYTVSYLALHGHYAGDNGFRFPKVSGALTAVKGTYTYGGGFPTSTFESSNYYVDVAFTPSGSTPPPTTKTTASTTPRTTAPTTPRTTAPTTPRTTAPTTTPASSSPSSSTTSGPPVGATNCSTSPHVCGFADETNSGIIKGAVLTKVPSQATSGPGWKCSGTNCSGGVTITGNVGSLTTGLELADGIGAGTSASNITIMNLKLDGVHGQSTDGIEVAGTTTGVVIDHCDVQGSAPGLVYSADRGWNGIHIKDGAANYTVNHCNIHGFASGIFPETEQGTDVFVGNFVHQIVCWDYYNGVRCDDSRSNAGTHDHCNNWGDGGGPSDLTSSILLKDNTFWGDNPVCMSDEIALFPDGAPQTNQHTTIDHNLIGGAGYCVNPGYGDAFGSAGRSYVGMKNNSWSTRLGSNCGSYGVSYIFPLNSSSGTGNYQCANIWDDGPMAGSGADQDNRYPTKNQPVTKC